MERKDGHFERRACPVPANYVFAGSSGLHLVRLRSHNRSDRTLFLRIGVCHCLPVGIHRPRSLLGRDRVVDVVFLHLTFVHEHETSKLMPPAASRTFKYALFPVQLDLPADCLSLGAREKSPTLLYYLVGELDILQCSLDAAA